MLDTTTHTAPPALRHRAAGTGRAVLCALVCLSALLGVTGTAHAVQPDGPDLEFILEQIKRSEAHAAGGTLLGTGPNQVSDPLLPYGLRTVDGRHNNLRPGQSRFGAADELMPRLLAPVFLPGESFDQDGPFGPALEGPTSYANTRGVVADSQPRVISNLIVDQSTDNPAAVAAADGAAPDADGNLPIPNSAPDTGLSAPFNSWFTLFGQFFDHGLDLTTKGGSGTVMVPLKESDPLFVPGSHTNFMVLTRATNQRGPDNVLGTPDDVREHENTTTSFVDQNQTYTSHPSHQVFLREYELNGAGRPVATGRLLDRPGVGGLARWADVKAQAREMLGIALDDQDVLNLPLVSTDQYGRFIPDPDTGFAQIVTSPAGAPVTFASGTPGAPVDATNATRTRHAFLDDIAHHAVPFGDHDNNPATPRRPLGPDATDGTNDDNVAGTFDDELLDAHFITGDGRGNENIGLTAVHHVFHAEHNLRVGEIRDLILEPGAPAPADWQLPDGSWSGERLFQAARFITEMEYQHLVFEEFARKVQPQVNVFAGYQTDIDPAIVAEFAHTVYRFGHSMLTEDVARTKADGTNADVGLIEGFLNPLAFNDDGAGNTLSPEAAAGSIVRGMTRQRGAEIDEFVTGALRNNLVGLPLDLATINIARGREAGVPTLNAARRQFHDATGSSALAPYESWTDFGLGIRHPESLTNFVAAYGKHPTITAAGTIAAKRAAAELLVDGGAGAPDDREAFMASPSTGVEDIDFWVGGLAEKQMPFGGLLGSTFNFVFETQMEKLQDGDRFYYLSRTAGLNFLTQLEENSFAELIMRTTDTTHLPFDVFSRPDFTFELANLGGSGPVQDDPDTDYDESALLTRGPNGTLRFSGGEHVVFGGTDGPDRMHSSEGDDSLWGDGGDDRLEGGSGNDALSGGPGDDLLTDLFGDDNLKGGDGDDTINAGGGLDLILAGKGRDFVAAGNDPKETFAGPGDDFVIAGDSADIVFGNEGDDWIEGGDQADLLQGDNGAPFNDGGSGNDVLTGDGGGDDYDSEGGDDVMVSGPGTTRNEGMLGFDWVTHRRDAQAADADLNFTGLLPPDEENLADRFDNVEGLSGWNGHDVLRGDDTDQVAMEGHELTDASLVGGLSELLDGATTFTGGNVILGGAGSDLIEGRGGNDVIDGDAWFDVYLSVRDAADPSVELRRADTMRSVRADMFAGRLTPSQLRVVRSIERPTGDTGVDTAVFTGPQSEYDFSPSASTTRMTVTHARGTQVDGTDVVRNVERLTFSDGTIEIDPITTNDPPSGSVDLSDQAPAEDRGLTAARAFDDADGVDAASIAFGWQVETDPGVWATVTAAEAFTPGDAEVGSRLRVVATFRDGDGVTESVVSTPTAAVTNVNDAATGRPGLTHTTPQEGRTVTAQTASIADPDGLPAAGMRHQWQEQVGGGFNDIVGATDASFTPTAAQVGRALRVVASFTDTHGTAESVASEATSPVTSRTTSFTLLPPVPGAAAGGSAVGGSSPSTAGTDGRRAGTGTSRRRLVVSRVRAKALRRGLAVTVDVPAGARVVRIKVVRAPVMRAHGKRIPGFVATVFRRTKGGARQTFKLRSGKLGRLTPGRYRVEARAGASRRTLGPATNTLVQIRKGR